MGFAKILLWIRFLEDISCWLWGKVPNLPVLLGPLTEAHPPGLQSGPGSPGTGATVTHIPAEVGGACEFSEMTDEAAGHPPASQPWGGTEPCPVEPLRPFMFPICSAVMGFFFPVFFFLFPLKCTHAGFGYLSIFSAVASLINSPDGSPLHREEGYPTWAPWHRFLGSWHRNPEADMGDPK